MLEALHCLRELTVLSVAARLFFSALCGGVIGLEREYKRRPAGFRTHILICLGACLTTMTSQFLGAAMGYSVDMARMGAQVVAGIGFIGAGTIIVTRQQRVKGLTTAAGLWACAILGLAIGAGFYEGAVVSVVLILLAELLFVKLEYKLLYSTRENIFYIEYTDRACLEKILGFFRERNIRIQNMEITRAEKGDHPVVNAIFCVRLDRKNTTEQIFHKLYGITGVLSVEEL